MKNYLNINKFLLALVSFIQCTSIVFATDIAEYLRACKSNHKESVLIVGCGHSSDSDLEGNHLHPEAYCVNVENYRDFQDPSILKFASTEDDTLAIPQSYWQQLRADACLDITAPLHLTANFDTVVLERIWSKSLEAPYTLYNSAKLLKEDGLLIIDLHDSYPLNQYQHANENSLVNLVSSSQPFKGDVNPQYNFSYFGFYDTNISADEIKLNLNTLKCHDQVINLLNRFDYNLSKRPRMIAAYDGLINYLNNWGFMNVMLITNRVQPSTYDPIIRHKAGRKSNFIIATKSALTSQLMPEWRQSIKLFLNKK